MLKYSLILATVERRSEVAKFLASLDRQTYKHFELIVVDQNSDDRVSSLVDAYRDKFEIVYLKSTPGLSVARNHGLKAVTGDVVAFPDDDCWYSSSVLEMVARIFDNYDIDVVTGQSRDGDGAHSQRNWPSAPRLADKYSIWRLAISYTVFVRRHCIESIGSFDEQLGVGADSPWQSGEETDYLIRAVVQGYRVCYFPEIYVYHPQKTLKINRETIVRARVYGAGMGRVLGKNLYDLWFVRYMLFRPFVGAIYFAMTFRLRKAAFHMAVLHGRFSGWRSFERH